MITTIQSAQMGKERSITVAQKQKNIPKRSKMDRQHKMAAVLALLLAVLLLLPMITMIAGGAKAVTQSEIDALKNQQAGYQEKLTDLKSQLAELKGDQAQAEQKRKILSQELDAMDAELRNIDSQIAYYDKQISYYDKQIAYYDGQIAYYDGEISQKEEERKEAVAREEAQYDLFCDRVRSMEKDGNLSYWSILFHATDFSDLLDRVMLIGDVMDYDNAVMNDLIEVRKEIERIKTELEQTRAQQKAARDEQKAARDEQKAARDEQQAVRDQQAARRKEQAAKVQEAQQLLNQINADAAEVNRQLDAENAEMARVNREIARKQKELEAQRKQNNVVFETGSGYHWPLPGRYKLTSAFGYRIHPITGKPHSHTGIDIPAPAGTSIEACKGGQVVTSAYHSSYGNYVVIDHGNGNSTLYAHMSRRAVSEGQIVKQGQVIGYVGSTGSSTGNHLHLEVRDNYQRVNPENKFPSLPFDRAYNR